MDEPESSQRPLARKIFVWFVRVFLTALIGALVTLLVTRIVNGSPNSAPVKPISTPTPITSASSSAGGDSSDVQPSTPPSTIPNPESSTVILPKPNLPQFLADMQAVTTNGPGAEVGDKTIDKQEYPKSIWLCSDLELIANIYCDSDTGSTYWVDYNVPSGYGHFKATIGFSNNSPSDCDVTVEVLGDGATTLYSGEIVYGDSIPIDRQIASYQRIRVQIMPEKGKVCDTVFGNAQYTASPVTRSCSVPR